MGNDTEEPIRICEALVDNKRAEVADFTRFLQKHLPRNSALPVLVRRPREFVAAYRWLLVGLILSAAADLFTTLWNLRAYGAGVELHVVQRWISQLIGIEAGMPLAKFAQLVCVIFVAAWWRPWCRWILLLCSLLYALAAISNYFLLF